MSYYQDESGRFRGACVAGDDRGKYDQEYLKARTDFMIQGIKELPSLEEIGLSHVQKSLNCNFIYALRVLGELEDQGIVDTRDERGKHKINKEQLQ